MRVELLVKGFLIKPIMEILKKDYGIKSPSPSNLLITFENDVWLVRYSYSRGSVDFSNNQIVKDLLVEIKNNVLYEKVQLS
jgi:hypothetical protein